MYMKVYHNIKPCESKILPIGTPILTTYTNHAHLLSILSSYECSYEWILSNYIQIFINKDYIHNWSDFYFPASYDLRPSETCRWILCQKIHRSHIISKWSSIISFIIDSIDSNNYIDIMINYRYIPITNYYCKENILHDMLIYGYDLNKEILYGLDFFKEGRYGKGEISFSDLAQAFSMYDQATNTDYLNEMVYLYKFNDKYDKYKFSFDSVKNSINHYLSCKPPEYWNIYNYEDDKKNIDFGIGIYLSLVNYVKRIINNESDLDIRPFYLLYDHKKIMFERLKYLYKQEYLDKLSYDYIDKYSTIETSAKTIVNMIIKYYLSKNINFLYRIINILQIIEKEEFEILTHLF